MENTRKKIVKTRIEIYAFTYYGSTKEFCRVMGVTVASFCNWIRKRQKPSLRTAQYIEKMTGGDLTVDYLRNKMD